MTTPKRRYIDELEEGIKFSSGGPVSISLETAKRLEAMYRGAKEYDWLVDDEIGEFVDALDEEIPEPKP